MDAEHLEKLRRFCLTIALALITVVVAGVSISLTSDITVFGIPFSVSHPKLLALGLSIASVCSAVRFFYYGYMIGVSPNRKRRTALNALTVNPDADPKPSRWFKRKQRYLGREVSMWFGPTEFDMWTGAHDPKTVEAASFILVGQFPACFGKSVRASIKKDMQVDENNYVDTEYYLHVIIPVRCRLATGIEALDIALQSG